MDRLCLGPKFRYRQVLKESKNLFYWVYNKGGKLKALQWMKNSEHKTPEIFTGGIRCRVSKN